MNTSSPSRTSPARLPALLQLTRWSRVHAVVVCAGTALSVWSRFPSAVAWAAAASFAMAIALSRGQWTPTGQFGRANVITSVRLCTTLTLLMGYGAYGREAVAGVALAILLLDVVDGWCARRFREVSDFGARYDVEVDAFFVLALSVVLLVRGVAGPWVLLGGLWRYIYVLALWMVPSRIEAPRTRLGRLAYVLLLTSLVAGLLLPAPWASRAAAFGTTAVSLSFMRSFWQCYFSARPS